MVAFESWGLRLIRGSRTMALAAGVAVLMTIPIARGDEGLPLPDEAGLLLDLPAAQPVGASVGGFAIDDEPRDPSGPDGMSPEICSDADPVDPDPALEDREGREPPPAAEPSDRAEPADTDPTRIARANRADRMPVGIREHGPDRSLADSDPIAYAKQALAACKLRFEGVQDYTCTFIKRERIDGRLSGYDVMTMKARTKPRSVYFKFKQPKAGREAIYVHGRNNGKAIVHDVGIGKFLAGTLQLDPRSRRAMEGNRHPITEAGIGFLIETLSEGWHREMNPIDSVVTIREDVLVNKRPSTLIVCKHQNRRPDFVFHEVRLYIDQELGLPTRFEAYDWPTRPGEPAPLLEEYIYSDLKINVGLTDHDFDPSNKAYSFGRF